MRLINFFEPNKIEYEAYLSEQQLKQKYGQERTIQSTC
jgi:heat shock protein HspQ